MRNPLYIFPLIILILSLLIGLITFWLGNISISSFILIAIASIGILGSVLAFFALMFAYGFSGSAPNGGSIAWQQIKPILFKILLMAICSSCLFWFGLNI
jgi:hypothetical protein